MAAELLKRGAIFAPIMFGTVLPAVAGPAARDKVTQTLLMLAIFIPFSYFLDASSIARPSAAQRAAIGPTAARGS